MFGHWFFLWPHHLLILATSCPMPTGSWLVPWSSQEYSFLLLFFFNVGSTPFPFTFSKIILLQLKKVQPKYNLKDSSTSLNQILSFHFVSSSYPTFLFFKQIFSKWYTISFFCLLFTFHLFILPAMCRKNWFFFLLALFWICFVSLCCIFFYFDFCCTIVKSYKNSWQ